MKQDVEQLLQELVDQQKERLLQCGRSFVPQVTHEDIMQPNDFNELELEPSFRYEEGILDGMRVVQAAMQALLKETVC